MMHDEGFGWMHGGGMWGMGWGHGWFGVLLAIVALLAAVALAKYIFSSWRKQ